MRLFLIFCSRLNQTSVQHLWWNFFQKNSIIDVWQNLKNDSFRSSHQMRSIKKGVLRNFGKFTGQHMCQCLFLNKADFVNNKKETLAQVFSCEFCKIFKKIFFTEHLRTTTAASLFWLLLDLTSEYLYLCVCGTSCCFKLILQLFHLAFKIFLSLGGFLSKLSFIL